MVVGLRGIPNLQGGVERHCEQLYPLLASHGCRVELIGRSPFLKRRVDEYKGVTVRRLYSPDPRFKGLEAFVNTLIGTIYAGFKRPAILHIHAVGPSLFTPLAKLLGLRVVVTHHGFDYGREKWDRFGKAVISLGEYLGMKFADKCIVISEQIRRHVRQKYGVEGVKIPNGVRIVPPPAASDWLNRHRLEKGRYFLMVGRFVPEKRQGDLIQAFMDAQIDGWKLVLVGGLSPRDPYVDKIMTLAGQHRDILLTGFLTGHPLEALYACAGCFVLPSSHEGLPIAILEAMSYGVRVLASNIEANREIGLAEDRYFDVGNLAQLSGKMRDIARSDSSAIEKNDLVCRAGRYSWASIAKKTYDTYLEIAARRRR